MSESLILDSLEIRQFRAFRHLSIPRLQRVNLIVGKNNVGKTSLLETLWLYANEGDPTTIWRILETRDEGRRPRLGIGRKAEDIGLVLKNLFYGREDFTRATDPIQIGPTKLNGQTLLISPVWSALQANYTDELGNEIDTVQTTLFDDFQFPVNGFRVQLGKQRPIIYRLDGNYGRSPQSEKSCLLINANGLSTIELGRLWDQVSLTALEDKVLDSLRIISPSIERVTLINNPYTAPGRERIPIAKTSKTTTPIPLRSLGEGMSRLLGIALALVNAQNGMLLIDEVESGLHYSVQANVWRLIFETAHRLNVQVFATTHSWDCIEAFQHAAHEHPEEGLLIRLAEKKGDIVADIFDESELEIATREEVEVR